MAGTGPSILVVATDRHEGTLIVSTLREAGFTALVADAALPFENSQFFTAAVVAVDEADLGAALAAARALRPGLPAVIVIDPASARPVGENCAVLVKRPLDPRRLLGAVVELVLREDQATAPAPRHGHAAELGIAAARLACLCNRQTVAAAAGAARLAQDLSRQIGEMRSTCRGLAAAVSGFAVEGCAG